ncbi:U2 snRNP component prp10 [Coemansia reversa NRRL 1564]|uniref:U2 snRNP component prp10 n=1 Tax=Coemansia reversa (strain ATCC 12441 / NRRL 1564) TaxID=763665 RepID=A0A2G5BFS3_COERN|nr:U2 snRNP component prp10 [Coemansia reversa NRRL 1564]|eukprot:PIA17878.1 U2 snRNP component prp10 [Coemansia reversa NRRL 1564]
MADSVEDTSTKAPGSNGKVVESSSDLSALKYDTELYGNGDKYAGYDRSIETGGSNNDVPAVSMAKGRFGITAPREFIDELQTAEHDADEDPFKEILRMRGINRVIADRENDYQKRRHTRKLSNERGDGTGGSTYADRVRAVQLENEEAELVAKIKKAEASGRQAGASKWDVETPIQQVEAQAPQRRKRWDQTPADVRSSVAMTPQRRSRWDETPRVADGAASETPKRTRSRWDETPMLDRVAPDYGATPAGGAAIDYGATPAGRQMAAGLATPAGGHMAGVLTQQPGSVVDARNQYQTDEELDALLPDEGYVIMEAPASYVAIRTPARKLMSTPAAEIGGVAGFRMEAETEARIEAMEEVREVPGVGALPFFRAEDMQVFGQLLDGQDETELDAEARRERQALRLVLKIKNGTQAQRKVAMRQLGARACELGAAAVLNPVLALLMAAGLEDQERHVLVKAADRALQRLGAQARPFVHRILVVVEPLLIDEDRHARAEAREVISNVSKAAGLAAMLAALRPDVDHADEYVRNTTARALAVVAVALGVAAALPFLRAVGRSKRAWQARQTGARAVRHTAELARAGVLPHLRGLVDCVGAGLEDEHQAVRSAAALALAALAEAAAPYGIEAFDSVLKPLWLGVRRQRGPGLAAFLKAVGFVVPLMDVEHAAHYAREALHVVVREFQSPDTQMRAVVLRVVQQCVATSGVSPSLVRTDVLPDFVRCFWARRAALDRRHARHVIDATVALAAAAGGAPVVERLVAHLKDESAAHRAMAVDAVARTVSELGIADIDARLEELLMDGVLYAFQELPPDAARTELDALGSVLRALGGRAAPYLQQIASALLWRLNNPSSAVRQQAAALVAHVAPVAHVCGGDGDDLLARIATVLFECLGEEFPDVLAALLSALRAIVDVIGLPAMQPPVADLLPRLAPILKNRHEGVQEACINLVGRIADRAADRVPAREWMRCCFSLLDLLRAYRKPVRRAAVATFGFIARAIGPQDVLATLLNNLRVQDRQNRVCTTVAIAIVAESCAPFTVLPALMNEYRVPELNVQNGVLKALAFLFEYIGDAARDYVDAVAPLIADALVDRDLVHRQQAAAIMKHLALAVSGHACDRPMLHLLNHLWPNIFETSPHAICAVLEAIESCRVCLGPARILLYTLQGMFHPARAVRDVYWRIYNMTYVAAQPALVAFYPRIEDSSPNNYRRYELDYVL